MPFRPMRRIRQQLTDAENEQILQQGRSGVLAVLGDDGWPYAVPMSYVWLNGAVYLHCAFSGHKLDAITNCEKVSFCIVHQDEVVPEEYTTYYRSVIVFGNAKVLPDSDEGRFALAAMADKYHPTGAPEERTRRIDRQMPALRMIRIDPMHITGKQSIELTRKRETPESP